MTHGTVPSRPTIEMFKKRSKSKDEFPIPEEDFDLGDEKNNSSIRKTSASASPSAASSNNSSSNLTKQEVGMVRKNFEDASPVDNSKSSGRQKKAASFFTRSTSSDRSVVGSSSKDLSALDSSQSTQSGDGVLFPSLMIRQLDSKLEKSEKERKELKRKVEILTQTNLDFAKKIEKDEKEMGYLRRKILEQDETIEQMQFQTLASYEFKIKELKSLAQKFQVQNMGLSTKAALVDSLQAEIAELRKLKGVGGNQNQSEGNYSADGKVSSGRNAIADEIHNLIEDGRNNAPKNGNPDPSALRNRYAAVAGPGTGMSNPNAKSAISVMLAANPSLVDSISSPSTVNQVGTPAPNSKGVTLKTQPSASTPTIPDAPVAPVPAPVPAPPAVSGIPSVPSPLEPKKPKRKNLRVLHWERIRAENIPGTIWSQIEESGLNVSLDGEIVDELFEEKRASMKFKEDKEEIVAAGPNGVVNDEKAVLAINLLLGKLKISPDGLAQAIVEMNDNRLDVNQIKQLHTYLPDKETLETFAASGQNIEDMENIDRLYYRLSLIPDVRARLELWQYKLNFNDSITETMEKLVLVENAMEYLNSNISWSIILGCSLAIGNYLNTDHAKGSAQGFLLKESLPKIKTLKSVPTTKNYDQEVFEQALESVMRPRNLLEFLIMILTEKFPESLSFLSEIDSFRKALRVEQSSFLSTIEYLDKGLKKMESFLNGCVSEERKDHWYDILNEFYNTWASTVQSIYERSQELMRKFSILSRYYTIDKEAPKTWEEFLMIFVEFGDQLRSAIAEAKERREKIEKSFKAKALIASTSQRRSLVKESSKALIAEFKETLKEKAKPDSEESGNTEKPAT